jgi:hypothetical protein
MLYPRPCYDKDEKEEIIAVQKAAWRTFSEDVCELFNLLTDRTDEHPSTNTLTASTHQKFSLLNYYHPAADATHTNPSQRHQQPSGYITNIGRNLGRNGDDNWADRVIFKWKPQLMNEFEKTVDFLEATGLVYDCVNRVFVQGGEAEDANVERQLFKIIPSSLLFYRLLSLFVISDNKPQSQSSVWSAVLEYSPKQTFKLLLQDSYGLPEVRVSEGSDKDKDFVEAVVDLLNLLCSDVCPHPYDAVVAGSYA